jgi:hypothetical protein
MDSDIIECWNCGQKLRIRTDKIATAKCGNCQQMLVKQEPSKTERTPTGSAQQAASRPTRPRPSQGGNFIRALFGHVIGFLIGVAVFIVTLVVYIRATGDVVLALPIAGGSTAAVAYLWKLWDSSKV